MNSKNRDESILKRINEAEDVLKQLGFPESLLNDRSALTLLALLGLKPAESWKEAASPLVGITPMMDFFSEYYGKRYAPNSRETVRRFTIHQFLQAGLILANPDKPERPTNSPKAVYQIEPKALKLMRTYGTPTWKRNLKAYVAMVGTLRSKYANDRAIHRIPIVINNRKRISLSPGGQNILVKKILDDFCPIFTPGGTLIYVGDTNKKWAYFDSAFLENLHVTIGEHGKMPDLVVHRPDKNWLVLIEAVTSHGPVNPKRRRELKELFAGSIAGLVFVTAFLDRRAMNKYLSDISWETEVWVVDSPTHLIHFNGERFLGPYDD